MKTLFLAFSLFLSAGALACSCDYDYGSRSPEFMNRAGKLLALPGHEITVTDYKLELAAMAYADPAFYSTRSCGCTPFVKRVWHISFQREGLNCTAKAILQVWNNRMKIRNQHCI